MDKKRVIVNAMINSAILTVLQVIVGISNITIGNYVLGSLVLLVTIMTVSDILKLNEIRKELE